MTETAFVMMIRGNFYISTATDLILESSTGIDRK